MRNKLLFSTALVAAAFSVTPAYAEPQNYTGVYDSLENRPIDVSAEANTIKDVTVSGVSEEGDTYVRNGIFGSVASGYNTGAATISGTNTITNGGGIELANVTVDKDAVINISGKNDLLPDGDEGREEFHKGSLLAAYETLTVNGGVINVTNGGMLLAGKKGTAGTFDVKGGTINVDNSFLISDNNGTISVDGSAAATAAKEEAQKKYAESLSNITSADLQDKGASLVSTYAADDGVVAAKIQTYLNGVAETAAESENTDQKTALENNLSEEGKKKLEGIDDDKALAEAIENGSLTLTKDDFSADTTYSSETGDLVNQAAIDAYNADDERTALEWSALSAEAQKKAESQVNAAAAAVTPAINLTGNNKLVGVVSLKDSSLAIKSGKTTTTAGLTADTGAVTSIAAGAELEVAQATTLKDGSVTNVDGKFASKNNITAEDGSEINLTGEINSQLAASGVVNVNGSDAFIAKYTGSATDTLNINASTSVSELFGSASSATNLSVAEGTEFVLDSVAEVQEDEEAGIEAADAINLTAENATVAGTLKFADNTASQISTAIDVASTGTVDAGLNAVAAKITTAEGSTLVAGVANGEDGAVKSGSFTSADNELAEGTKVRLAIEKGTDMSKLGEDGLELGDKVNEALKDGSAKLADNFAYDINIDEDGKITVSKTSTAGMVSNLMAAGVSANAAGAAAAWTDAEGSTPMGKLLAENIYNRMSAGDARGAGELAEAAAPTAAPMVRTVETQLMNQAYSAVSSQLSGGAIASAAAGKSSGDSLGNGVSTWVQTLINRSELDDMGSAKGFDVDTYGVALGVQKQINNHVKAGVAYAYGDSEIDGHLRDTDVESHTFMAYAEYKPSNWYVNGIASYGMSDYSEKRHVLYGVDADYDVKSYGLQAMTGYDFNFDGYNVTPEAGLRYAHLRQDGYTDTAGQRVSAEDMDILTGVIGVKADTNIALDNGINLRPEARLAMTYDLMNADNNAAVNIGNGYYHINGEELDRFGIEAGAGVTAELNDAWDVSAGYEGRFRDDYKDHSGVLSAKYKF